MFTTGPPLVQEDLVDCIQALLVADSLSISALTSDPRDLTPSLEALDESLEWLSKLSDTLSTRRNHIQSLARERDNAGLPIMRCLFPDIFPMVVECLQIIEGTSRGNGLSLVRVSHVSRGWRRSSLSLAAIWARYPAVFGADGLDCVLARTNGLPLDLRIDNGCRIPFEKLLPRAKKLIYSRRDNLDYKFLCHQALPNLEVIRLSEWHPRAISLPLASHPRLRTIHFDGIYIPFLSAVKNIVNLRLTSPSTTTFTTADFMTVLQDAPFLRSVVLSRNETAIQPDLPSLSLFPVLSLPQLRSIHLRRLPASEICYIMKHMSLPEATEVRLFNVCQSTERYNVIQSLLRTLSSAPKFAANLACRITRSKFTFETSVTLTSLDEGIVEVELEKDTRKNILRDSVGDFVASQFALRIHTLHMNGFPAISMQLWRWLLTRVELVAEIIVQLPQNVSDEPSVLDNLVAVLTQPDEQGRLVAPHLRTIGCTAIGSSLDPQTWRPLNQLVAYRQLHSAALHGTVLVGGTGLEFGRRVFDKFVETIQQTAGVECTVSWENHRIEFT